MDGLKILVLMHVVICSYIMNVQSSHFRGGTISWMVAPGTNTTVLFTFKMGWTYGQGPGCNDSMIGEFIDHNNMGYWQCISGCLTHGAVVGNTTYWCTGASEREDWEDGENTFNYTFPELGPYTIAFQGSAWMSLSYGQPSDWNIQTIVDLHKRSDTGTPNSSPRTASRPMYRLQYDCPHQLKLPMIDQDGDRVKCRWARGEECASVCEVLPSAHLDEDTCTVSFDANSTQNYSESGWYAVALTVEDFPQTNITIGNMSFTPNDPITAVPLQFLVFTPIIPVHCSVKPEFIYSTPKEGDTIYVKANGTLHLSYYAQVIGGENDSISDLSATRPPGLKISAMRDDPARLGVSMWDIEWTPKEDQAGVNILCTLAEDTNGKSSDPRCVSLVAWDVDPCSNLPCSGNQTCQRIGFSNKYECLHHPGCTGNLCKTDVDPCSNLTCSGNQTCQKIGFSNNYECLHHPGCTGNLCETDVDPCSNLTCSGNQTCQKIGFSNNYECLHPPGCTGTLCETGPVTSSSSSCLSSLPVILGSVFGSLVLLASVVGCAVWWWCTRKLRKVNDNSRDHNDAEDVNNV